MHMPPIEVTPEVFNEVITHAISNYDVDGWDYVVETMGVREIQDIAVDAQCQTVPELIRAVGDTVLIYKEMETEYWG
jgi:hypothetical protein